MGSLLVLMVVISAVSAILLWATRLPSVSNEIHLWLGTTPAVNQDGTDRGTQLVFLLFCYSAPLMVVGLLNSTRMIMQVIEGWRSSKEEFDDELQKENVVFPEPSAPDNSTIKPK